LGSLGPFLQVNRLIDLARLVEIAVDAVIGGR
jgi:hypothetical protein